MTFTMKRLAQLRLNAWYTGTYTSVQTLVPNRSFFHKIPANIICSTARNPRIDLDLGGSNPVLHTTLRLIRLHCQTQCGPKWGSGLKDSIFNNSSNTRSDGHDDFYNIPTNPTPTRAGLRCVLPDWGGGGGETGGSTWHTHTNSLSLSLSLSFAPTPSLSLSFAPTPSLSLSHSHQHPLSLSLTYTHSLSLSFAPTPSLSLSLSPSHTHSLSLSHSHQHPLSLSFAPTPPRSLSFLSLIHN